MRNDNPESSFQSPENYREYAKEASMALAVYQRIRRPLMFHVLVVWLFFIPKGTRYYTGRSYRDDDGEIVTVLDYYDPSIFEWMFNNAFLALPYTFYFIILLGFLAIFRRLDDGFQAEDSDNPVFTLSTRWATLDVVAGNTLNRFQDYVGRLKWSWFWKTWVFYPVLFFIPTFALVIGLIRILKNGCGFFMDLFFLRSWDKWLKALEKDEESVTTKHLRGSKLTKMPKSAGSSPVQWVKKKAGQAKGATKTFLEMCGYDEAAERALMQQAKTQQKPKPKKPEKPPQDDDSQSTNKGEDDST